MSHRCIAREFLIQGLALICFVGAAANLFGQATGRVGGTVVDSTGAVVPGASVECTNNETGLSRTVSTNQDGIFEFPDMPIGEYRLTVTKQGFESEKTDHVPLVTGQIVDLKIAMKIGNVNETVEVTTEAPLVDSASSSIKQSVTEKQMQDLPLNGRNALQLTTMAPGTVLTNVGTESGQQDNVGLSVNGLRATQNNFQLDGVIYNDRFFDSVPTMPNPDGLEEFTIQSSDYSAEYGGAGALVQLSTRSGTNQIHGSAFEFIRNTDLDARNFFNITLPPFKLNQFGGTAGGPIKRNKTFFFFSAQDTQRRSAPSPISITTPTAAERAGDFSAIKTQLTDPVPNGPKFTNNQVPVSMFNPISVAIANALLPLPNSGTQYIGVENQNLDDTQYLVKIDQIFSQNDHFSVRYFYDQDNFQRPFNAPTGFYAENLFRNQTLVLNETHIFSPTFTATFFASGGRFARTQIPEAPGLKTLQDFGQQVPLGTSVPIFPGIRDNISGFVDIFSGGALRQDSTSFDYKASGVKILGGHTLNFGAEFERTRIDANDYSYTPGDNTFNGQVTGSALVDFYLGYESNFFQDNGRTFYLREDRPSIYVEDDWKVNKELTLNLGVRWDPWLPPIDKNNTLTAFVPGQQSTVAPNAPLGLLFPGDKGISNTIFPHDWRDFAPRVGFAWNIDGNGKTVIRSAYGIFYSFPEGLLYQRTDATQPTDLYLNIPAPYFTNPYQGFAGGDPFPRPHISPSQFSTYQFVLPISGGVLDPSSKVGYTQNWNFTIEHQLPSNTALSVAYVGNHGVDIMASRQFNPAIFGPGATVANENSRRLYPGLGAVELASSYDYEEFESLQVKVTRRFSKQLSLLSSFVWGKTIDDTSSGTEGQTGPPNPFNFASARGPADFDQEYRFSLSAVYNLPHWSFTGFRNVLLNDWQVNSIVSLYSGLPFTVTSGTDQSRSGIGNDYANVIGNPARPSGVSQVQEYFNTAAFVPATIGTFGTVGRNTLRGPGFFDVDASLFKNFSFSERWRLQFRAEAFNIENRPNFQNPSSTVSSGTYGRITAANDPRVLQFALKLLF